MTLQEITNGESKNVEFKVELPKKSEKYMKSVIAFANTSGGKIVLGVDDETRTIVGVDEKSVFQIMDNIANAISDSCEPQIIPNITFQTIHGKCVVVVEIYPGANRPYYFRSFGKASGTYIRGAGRAEIEGIVRRESYELPIGAIREMIVNAVCHRNYMDNSCVQVAVYDNRVEVTSPGMLYGGLTLEEAMSGRSKIRNRAIAEVFSRMEIIEEWGTGIRRIIKRAQEFGLSEPEFLEIGDTFRVNLYRKADKKPIKADKKPIKTEREELVMMFVEENGSITNREARELLGLAESTVKRILKEMVKEEKLMEKGDRKTRKYLKKN